MERARAEELEYSAVMASQEFVAKARRGDSQVLKSGEVMHAMQGQCSGQVADGWARRNAATTFKATFSEHGTPESKILVRAWCHRMQHFFNLEMAALEPASFVFTAAHLAAYEEPIEFTDLAMVDGHPRWRKWMARIRAIRNIPRTAV